MPASYRGVGCQRLRRRADFLVDSEPAGPAPLRLNGGPATYLIYNLGTVTPPVPEPETHALILAGLGVVGFLARRRKKQQG